MIEMDPGKALDLLGATVTMVSVAAGERRNAMSATRFTVLAPKPPLVAVSVSTRRYSHDLISEAGEFVVNVASTEQVEVAAKLGSGSGRNGDKLSLHGVQTTPATRVNAPMIVGSVCCIECKLVNTIPAGDYTVFIGEVLALHVDENAMPLLRHKGKYRVLGA